MIYVLNRDLEITDIIDTFTSLIWARRYYENGDCEIYLPATEANVEKLKTGNLVIRDDDDMICEIVKTEITTSVEDGDYLIATGIDLKSLLDRRLITRFKTSDAQRIETIIRQLVYDSLGQGASESRMIKNSRGLPVVWLGQGADIPDLITKQATLTNLGEFSRELCRMIGCGYKIYKDGDVLRFELTKGVDRSGSVMFSKDFDNLFESDYVNDKSEFANVAYVAGSGEGSARIVAHYNHAESWDRYEIEVDARNDSNKSTLADVKDLFPNGTNYTSADGWIYSAVMATAVLSDWHLVWLNENFQGTVNNSIFTTSDNVLIASGKGIPSNDAECVIEEKVYKNLLFTDGAEALAEHEAQESFEGSVDYKQMYVYKKDFDLGDIVMIDNGFGIIVPARITEVIETDDENGHTVQPTFVYKEE